MNYFKGIVGQRIVKRQLGFYIDSYKTTGVLSHLLIVGNPGNGKTQLSRLVAKNLGKPLLEINSSTIRKVEEMVEIYDDYIDSDKSITLFFDECHLLSSDIQNVLLTILNPNSDNKNVLRYRDRPLLFNFKKVSFIFSTTNPEEVCDPLKDRCKKIALEEYSYRDIAEIITSNMQKSITFEKGVLDEIASTCRGNGRQSISRALDHLNPYINQKKISRTFKRIHWNDLRHLLGILPYGIDNLEYQILKTLERRYKPLALSSLSAATGIAKEALQKDHEIYPLKRGLIEVSPKGRFITNLGKQVLVEIEKEGYFK